MALIKIDSIAIFMVCFLTACNEANMLSKSELLDVLDVGPEYKIIQNSGKESQNEAYESTEIVSESDASPDSKMVQSKMDSSEITNLAGNEPNRFMEELNSDWLEYVDRIEGKSTTATDWNEVSFDERVNYTMSSPSRRIEEENESDAEDIRIEYEEIDEENDSQALKAKFNERLEATEYVDELDMAADLNETDIEQNGTPSESVAKLAEDIVSTNEKYLSNKEEIPYETIVVKPRILSEDSMEKGTLPSGEMERDFSEDEDIKKSHSRVSRSACKICDRKCRIPKFMDHSELRCTIYPSETICKQTCVFGYTLNQGVTRTQKCSHSHGSWSPSKKFSDCKPFIDCTIRLKPGGKKKCYSNYMYKGAKCRISCKGYADLKTVPAKTYRCHINGKFSPPLPHCARAGGGQRLVERPPKVRPGWV